MLDEWQLYNARYEFIQLDMNGKYTMLDMNEL